MTNRFDHLQERLDSLPTRPGVYQMKDESGTILYIGKAKSLRSRVRSYFRAAADHSNRIGVMVCRIKSIDIIVTASEMEALLLEDNLIKEWQPAYNVLLKDDKRYPYLKLTMAETWPRLLLVRSVINDGAEYFGPYVSAKTVRATMRLIQKIFPLRQSRDSLDGKPVRRPCLNHQMGRCLAPCAGRTSPEEYMEVVSQVALFLRGKATELTRRIEAEMWRASKGEQFELAGRYRDQLDAIGRLTERQSVSQTARRDEDVITFIEREARSIITLFQVRGGRMIGERSYPFDQLGELDRPEALGAFMRQFYRGDMKPPPTILVNETPEDIETIVARLSMLRGANVSIEMPQRGRKKKLLDLAASNGALALTTIADTSKGVEAALDEIAKTLGLEERPELIEGYDISNTSGIASVGSAVTFRAGLPDKSGYRKYKIKTVRGADDYASMAEVICRRFGRIDREGKSLPSLLVIDGGAGQLTAVIEAFANIGVAPPPVIGIAKGSDRENPESDQIFLPGEKVPVPFPSSSPGKFLLLRVRDESHRFAGAYHKKLRDGALTRSSLDKVLGVGPKRKKKLLVRFGSVKKIKEASVEDIAATIKVSMATAQKIHDSL